MATARSESLERLEFIKTKLLTTIWVKGNCSGQCVGVRGENTVEWDRSCTAEEFHKIHLSVTLAFISKLKRIKIFVK